MEAIVIRAKGEAELRNTSVPTIRDHWILVKVKAVALNPTDFKAIDNGYSVGAKVGCDYSGVVEQVGNYVTRFKAGDRVAGLTHGS
jgi:NADPH:quinone reductase-like Zn-dependent oxidoreductase